MIVQLYAMKALEVNKPRTACLAPSAPRTDDATTGCPTPPCANVSIISTYWRHKRIAKVFKNGPSQAVRLPKVFRFEQDEAFIRRFGNAVVLLPISHPWEALISSLEMFTDDVLASREQRREDLLCA